MNMIIHDDGHTNVIAADGLLPVDDVNDENGNLTQKGIYSKTGNKGFAYGRFDFIITNPPFSSVIKQKEQAYMRQYGYALKEIDWLNPASRQAVRDNQEAEILFIEQCHNYLRAGGYLAIVLPDGILTNSSLQYVRDGIEEKFRIVAVVSMPQTAFVATGAGVKTSVLFLKKHTAEISENIKNQKTELQDNIKENNRYPDKLHQIETEKKRHIKELQGLDSPENLEGKALKQSEAYKKRKKEITATYKEKIDALKERLIEKYLKQKQTALDDYPVFMAIAEDIGYDAAGRPTKNNELEIIGKEIARFIESIEREEA